MILDRILLSRGLIVHCIDLLLFLVHYSPILACNGVLHARVLSLQETRVKQLKN